MTMTRPDSFAWGDICDVYGRPYHIGDQMRLDTPPAFPSFDAELGPTTLLYFEVPDSEGKETDYVTGRPKDPAEVGGWTHYKLRELTVFRGTRVSPQEALRMIRAIEADQEEEQSWMPKARSRIADLTGPNGQWVD